MKPLCVIFAVMALPLAAHHSFKANFDDSRTVTMTGSVTAIQWTNPHVELSVDIPDPEGKIVHWTMELAPPNTLKRQGWSKDDLKPGDRISVEVWLARSGEPRATMSKLTMPDGSVRLGQTGWL